jgi:hypothetical protein
MTPSVAFSPRVVLVPISFLVLGISLGCRGSGPEYREPPPSHPHGILVVDPLTDEGGGGLRSIDDARVFPRDEEAANLGVWIHREWRVKPGLRSVEIFAGTGFLRRTVRIREGVRLRFFVETLPSPEGVEIRNYNSREEDVGPAPGK